MPRLGYVNSADSVPASSGSDRATGDAAAYTLSVTREPDVDEDGEAVERHAQVNGIGSIHPSPDGETLAFSAADPVAETSHVRLHDFLICA